MSSGQGEGGLYQDLAKLAVELEFESTDALREWMVDERLVQRWWQIFNYYWLLPQQHAATTGKNGRNQRANRVEFEQVALHLATDLEYGRCKINTELLHGILFRKHLTVLEGQWRVWYVIQRLCWEASQSQSSALQDSTTNPNPVPVSRAEGIVEVAWVNMPSMLPGGRAARFNTIHRVARLTWEDFKLSVTDHFELPRFKMWISEMTVPQASWDRLQHISHGEEYGTLGEDGFYDFVKLLVQFPGPIKVLLSTTEKKPLEITDALRDLELTDEPRMILD
ncbi:uncharacterized protein K452DRAFT_302574 [Aplosporella prunicola CBS 121167]|uniref:Uncharacterized protein n=1 Tax=Aplosporella prunicola CBS 121167 TaxID=1176127 RepID=A0A6A6AZD1_9PEZI|nr:uncharacterized protein K452DRAFT_302574 [Aplosporella prunicola CBS 121167]KAF2136628.1 hypothetical protein K452DRAFT_302574 [Aplosporella prunicola CBS 121167]